MDTKAAIKRAAKALGSQTNLAKALDVTPQAVSRWTRVPAERVLDVERVSGIPRTVLRPDLYPPEDAAA